MSTGSKADLVGRLNRAERQADSLARLKDQIESAMRQVEVMIGGSASGVDRRVLRELAENLQQLDSLVLTMRAAVAEGHRFADTLQ